MSHFTHTEYMLMALAQAEQRRGFCSPNPAVGAVIVKDNTVLAKGCHWQAGAAHAEVAALEKFHGDPQNCTLYVTLEPCCHWGKTPPCTEAIIASGIKHVLYGCKDPHHKVNGGGEAALRQAGIRCEHVYVPAVHDFYQSYQHWLTTHTPWVTIKLAISRDAKIAGPGGKPIHMTGPALDRYTHQQRKRADATLTTARTVNNDDPQMNVRLDDEVIAKPLYVLDSHLSLQLDRRILNTTQSITVFHRQDADAVKLKSLLANGIRCVAVPTDTAGLSLAAVLEQIGADGVHDLWVEVGARCFTQFHKQKLANKIIIYKTDMVLGADALPAFTSDIDLLDRLNWTTVGQDKLAIYPNRV